MPKKGLYRGFSTFEFQKSRTFKVTDIEAVKLDLLNHIFTTRGSRTKMPNFGTNIPNLVFEPLDNLTVDALQDELRAVFDYDPRVSLITLEVTPYEDLNIVVASATLRYIELNIVDTMNINIQFEESF